MAKSNYQYKKRQKEIARMKKRELKRQRKINKNNPEQPIDPESLENTEAPQ